MPSWKYLSFPLKGDDASVLFELDGIVCAALADGVGSYSGGGLAARTVVDLVGSRALRKKNDFENLFRECKDALIKSKDVAKLGTTLTVMSLLESTVLFGHVGDCRIYHLRGGGVKTMTNDQTELAYLVGKGVLNRYEAKNYKRSSVLMSVLAPDKDYSLQFGSFNVMPGDRLILCSDGFYGVLSKRTIRDISVDNSNFDEFVDAVNSVMLGIEVDDDASALLLEV
jgi:protein phosphatase